MRAKSLVQCVKDPMRDGSSRRPAVEALEGRQLLAGVGLDATGEPSVGVAQRVARRVSAQVNNTNHLLGTYSGWLVVEGAEAEVRRMVLKVTGQAPDRSLAGQMILDDDATIGGDLTTFAFTGLFAGRNLTLNFNDGDGGGAGGFTGRIFNRGQRLTGSVTLAGDESLEGQVRLLKRSAPDLTGGAEPSAGNGFLVPVTDGAIFGATPIDDTGIVGVGDILSGGGSSGNGAVFGSQQGVLGNNGGSIF